ncbi:hypothetical protein KC332_g259 [Hortaea werneckii]|uniref:Uncharacterized protein n=1 Tax=Hortaea werneckii EXF-2000 TaxID=1157616 RepID=A0A1Z5TIE0_HORWE|nr:hypothetical protein KC358_g373 [Hortaea werneckii]OTA35783.1 hypothetical protein BTJ68_06588 [Hortaea werneckii EXF-2000]KAI6852901.1 hypothetical protein KC350_g451 [Hortaea werneckii]KAI6944995.1 hypothetical protein KC341_g397 [Hortaea werneckii]KAI6949967.1 hypothetical protein KC348_g973 [Hortaea werneckii]
MSIDAGDVEEDVVVRCDSGEAQAKVEMAAGPEQGYGRLGFLDFLFPADKRRHPYLHPPAHIFASGPSHGNAGAYRMGGSEDTWSAPPTTPLTGGLGSTPQPSDSESDPELDGESPITSSLPSSEQGTPSHRYPKRTFRSYTVEREVDSVVDKFGRRVKLQWATKPFPTKFIKRRANGEEYVTIDGQDYTIANRSPISEDSDGNTVCRVNFVDSWEPEGNLDPPQIIDSSPVSSQGRTSRGLTSDPPSPQGPNLRPRLRGQLRRPTRAAWMKRVQLSKRPQHGTERASSALTWPDLDLAHIEDLREHATSDTADYGPAIHQKIQEAVKRGQYDTTTGVLTAVLDRYQHDTPQRPVQFATWTVRHATHKFNFHGKENAGTFYAHWTGYDVRKPCTRCANQDREYGVFRGCVVASGFNQASDPSGFQAAKRLPKASTYTIRSLAASMTPSDLDEDRQAPSASRSLPQPRSISTDYGQGLADDDFIRDSNRPLRSQNDEGDDEFVMSGGLNGLDGIDARGRNAESGRRHDQGKTYDAVPDDSDHDFSDGEDPVDDQNSGNSSHNVIEEGQQNHRKRQRDPIVIESSDESSDDSSDEDVDVYKRLRDLFRMKPSGGSSDDSDDSDCESAQKRQRLTSPVSQSDAVDLNGRAHRARSRTLTSSQTAVPEASNAPPQLTDTRTPSNYDQESTSARPITSLNYADMVFRGHKLRRGEITQGQLDFLRMRSFDKDSIDWVGNEWRHAMHERKKKRRTEALVFYKANGRRFLNKYLVPRVCPVSMESL